MLLGLLDGKCGRGVCEFWLGQRQALFHSVPKSNSSVRVCMCVVSAAAVSSAHGIPSRLSPLPQRSDCEGKKERVARDVFHSPLSPLPDESLHSF